MRTRGRGSAILVGLVLGAILAFASTASAFNLNWQPATGYTDGMPFEAEIGVTYDIFVDNVVQATNVTGSSWPIPQSLIGHNKALVFTMQTVLSTGARSVFSLPFSWTSPEGIPNAVDRSGMSVTP